MEKKVYSLQLTVYSAIMVLALFQMGCFAKYV